jgi:hypothetical protein
MQRDLSAFSLSYQTAHWPSEEHAEALREELAVWLLKAQPGQNASVASPSASDPVRSIELPVRQGRRFRDVRALCEDA